MQPLITDKIRHRRRPPSMPPPHLAALFVSVLLTQTLKTLQPTVVQSRATNEDQVSAAVEVQQQSAYLDGVPTQPTTPIQTKLKEDTDPDSESTTTTNTDSTPRETTKCGVYSSYGINDLTPVDILVTATDSDNACIKATFLLSFRVEEPTTNQTNRIILGYVPLEHVIEIEQSCPEKPNPEQTKTKDGKNQVFIGKENGDANKSAIRKKDENDDKNNGKENDDEESEQEMIVTFDCGKLAFTFRRDKNKIYVSAIKGVIKLDDKIVSEFSASRPMFATSDLDHHFKYKDGIEVESEVRSRIHVLTAQFYLTEFEAFRTTTRRDFIKPPDEKSKPFLDEDT